MATQVLPPLSIPVNEKDFTASAPATVRYGHDTIEILIESGSHEDAGYLSLGFSHDRGAWFTDVIAVRPAYRRQGIGTRLMTVATELIGYEPAPEVIMPSAVAKGFWSARGHAAGFNQSKLDAA
jgi:GNAT superfamily N-acetyltransferase